MELKESENYENNQGNQETYHVGILVALLCRILFGLCSFSLWIIILKYWLVLTFKKSLVCTELIGGEKI